MERTIELLPFTDRKKVAMLQQDILSNFEMETNSFDGAVCFGTLHVFSVDEISRVFSEVKRVVKKRGSFIFDLAFDLERTDAISGDKLEPLSSDKYTVDTVDEVVALVEKNFIIEYSQVHSVSESYEGEGDNKYYLDCQYYLFKCSI
jgi:ubiquinone/menaquinone biosynthesis C-methylase UbiE